MPGRTLLTQQGTLGHKATVAQYIEGILLGQDRVSGATIFKADSKTPPSSPHTW
jgi:hypothetical protein